MAADFLAKQIPIMQSRQSNVLPTNVPQGMNPARAAAFVDLCQMLLPDLKRVPLLEPTCNCLQPTIAPVQAKHYVGRPHPKV